jgi:hypothetical protein
VQLRHALAHAERTLVQRDLALQHVEVRRSALVVTRHHLVAGAVVADRFAKRQMHIHRQRRRGIEARQRRARGQRLFVVGARVALVKTIGGRVRGVAWAVGVEAAQQVGGEDGGAHGCTVRA